MMNPLFQRKMMELQAGGGVPTSTEPVSFDKDKAKEIFYYVEEQKAEMMQGMKGRVQPRTEEEGMEQTMEIIVQHQRLSDKIHEKFGVDEEEFTRSLTQFQLMQDPEIQAKMRESFAGMPPEFMQSAAQAFSGQGGPQGGAPMGMGGF